MYRITDGKDEWVSPENYLLWLEIRAREVSKKSLLELDCNAPKKDDDPEVSLYLGNLVVSYEWKSPHRDKTIMDHVVPVDALDCDFAYEKWMCEQRAQVEKQNKEEEDRQRVMEERKAARQEEQERAQFERLRKKYGGS